jgi:Ca-activated chloride channel homolog
VPVDTALGRLSLPARSSAAKLEIMRSFILLALTAAVVASGLVIAAQQPTFRTGVKTVPLYVTVVDAQGRLVPDLVREDFEIYDNGKLQEIVLFDNDIRPFSAVVMLDTSGSMTILLDRVKQAAEQFLIRLLPDDRAMVGAFNDKVQLVGSFTSDRDELIASLRDLGFGNGTRLYDAAVESLDQLDGIEGRKVLLLLSDGEDTTSRTRRGTVVDRARAEEVMIYGIGLRSEYFNGQRWVRTNPDRLLRSLAEETGGGYYPLDKGDQLTSTFTRVAQELRSQYLLAFTPESLDGKVHRLEVKVKRGGMQARARRTYVAQP